MASPSSNDLDEDWLCDQGSYLNYIRYSRKHQPGLRKPDPGNWLAPVRGRSVRVALVDLESNGGTSSEFLTVEQLTQHLTGTHARKASESKRRIFVMEGLRPDFIKEFGEFFGMEPSFFAMQERKGTTFDFNENLDHPTLPSLLQPENSFCIRYYELWAYTGDVSFQEETTVLCKQTGRPIMSNAWRYKRDATGHSELLLTVPRKCSVWVRKHNPSDWDAVVLCDPRPKEIYKECRLLSGTLKIEDGMKLEPGDIIPFEGGYEDFIHQPNGYLKFTKRVASNEKLPPEPLKTSMLDDICHYYKHHSDLLEDFDDPTIFIKKIAAAHYLQLTSFVTHQLESIRSADWTGQGDRAGTVRHRSGKSQNARREDSLEAQWGRFRCSQYVYDIEATLLSLGIPWGDPSATRCEDWRTSEKDFQYISRRLEALRRDYDRLTTAMVGLGGMVRNKQALIEATQSLREAKTLKTLTFIAMFFIPLSWISGLFSMTGSYSPGGPDFWVYFAVSGPTLLLTFVISSLVQLGYDGRANWSFQTFLISTGDMFTTIGMVINSVWDVCLPRRAKGDANLPLSVQRSLGEA